MFLLIKRGEVSERAEYNISIHLMFLLIRLLHKFFGSTAKNFNTSHVSINRPLHHRQVQSLPNFNTSHVSINHTSTKGLLQS